MHTSGRFICLSVFIKSILLLPILIPWVLSSLSVFRGSLSESKRLGSYSLQHRHWFAWSLNIMLSFTSLPTTGAAFLPTTFASPPTALVAHLCHYCPVASPHHPLPPTSAGRAKEERRLKEDMTLLRFFWKQFQFFSNLGVVRKQRPNPPPTAAWLQAITAPSPGWFWLPHLRSGYVWGLTGFQQPRANADHTKGNQLCFKAKMWL